MITIIKETIDTEFLRPRESRFYPSDNSPCFEEWFLDNYDPSRNKSDRMFLPILTTELNKCYVRNRKTRWAVDGYFKNLNKSKKYAILCQHDDGVLFNMDGADVKVFGMGCKGDVQLPLVCQPHKYEFKEIGRPIFASFIGAITHPIRERLVKELKDKDGYFISTERTSLESYCKIMSMSKYCLAPFGYGKSSFRLCESLQFGCTPIYIVENEKDFLFYNGSIPMKEDEFYHNFESIGWDDSLPRMAKRNFNNFYTYSAVANMIYENLHSL